VSELSPLPQLRVTQAAAETLHIVGRQAQIFELTDFWEDSRLVAIYVAMALISRIGKPEPGGAQRHQWLTRPVVTSAVAQALRGRFLSTWMVYSLLDTGKTPEDGILQACRFAKPLRLVYPTLRVIDTASLWLQVHAQLLAGSRNAVTAPDTADIDIPEDFLAACQQHVMRNCCWQPVPANSIRRILQ
jgi:hypothetical protein